MTLICCMNVFRLSQLSGRKCSLKPGRCWQSHGKHRKASVRDFRSWVVESYLVLSRSKSYCHDLSRWIGWMVLCHAATRCPKMVIVVRMLKEGRGPYWNILGSWLTKMIKDAFLVAIDPTTLNNLRWILATSQQFHLFDYPVSCLWLGRIDHLLDMDNPLERVPD